MKKKKEEIKKGKWVVPEYKIPKNCSSYLSVPIQIYKEQLGKKVKITIEEI